MKLNSTAMRHKSRKLFSRAFSESHMCKMYSRFSCKDTYSQTIKPIEHAASIIPEAYTSDIFAKLENQKIFQKCWIGVTITDSLKNDGDSFFLNMPLYNDNTNQNYETIDILIVNKNGILVEENYNFPVKTIAHLVLVNVNSDTQKDESKMLNDQMSLFNNRFADQYPYNSMKCVGSSDYTMNCNWKLKAENFCEFYHFPYVHKNITNVKTLDG
eukprot:141473_1